MKREVHLKYSISFEELKEKLGLETDIEKIVVDDIFFPKYPIVGGESRVDGTLIIICEKEKEDC